MHVHDLPNSRTRFVLNVPLKLRFCSFGACMITRRFSSWSRAPKLSTAIQGHAQRVVLDRPWVAHECPSPELKRNL